MSTQEQINQNCLDDMRALIQKLRDAKPEERNELARRYAVTITELEKVLAYFYSYVVTNVAE